MFPSFRKRLIKEHKDLSANKMEGITLVNSSDNIMEFLFEVSVQDHALYKKPYYLSVQVTKDYPTDSPIVKFVTMTDVDTGEDSEIPIHPHIYSNGHICLNILGDDWTPACTIGSILLSIQSMLDANTCMERPVDNSDYVKHAPLNPKRTKFAYHDDNV